MQPHQQRVTVEREELAERLDRLGKFLWSDIFNKLGTEERQRLIEQFGHMRAYLRVLDERLAAF